MDSFLLCCLLMRCHSIRLIVGFGGKVFAGFLRIKLKSKWDEAQSLCIY